MKPSMKRAILLALPLLLAPACTFATVLYKSTGPNGVIEFSDRPPSDRPAVVIASIGGTGGGGGSASAAASGSDGLPIYDDGALSRANAQLDLAEHALAEALRAIGSPLRALHLSAPPSSDADLKRIDFFRRDVTLARQNLMEVLQTRQPAVRALASR